MECKYHLLAVFESGKSQVMAWGIRIEGGSKIRSNDLIPVMERFAIALPRIPSYLYSGYWLPLETLIIRNVRLMRSPTGFAVFGT